MCNYCELKHCDQAKTLDKINQELQYAYCFLKLRQKPSDIPSWHETRYLQTANKQCTILFWVLVQQTSRLWGENPRSAQPHMPGVRLGGQSGKYTSFMKLATFQSLACGHKRYVDCDLMVSCRHTGVCTRTLIIYKCARRVRLYICIHIKAR